MSLQAYDERVGLAWGKSFLDSDGTALVTVVYPGPSGARIDRILATKYGSGDNALRVWLYDSTESFLIGSVAVPGNAGYGSVPTVDVLAAILPAADPTIVLPYGFNLRVSLATALSSSEQLDVTVYGGHL